ncbi:MAG: Ig-like domain-containing protein [Methanobacteriaceae archaeon]|jgi:hypothetical protein|nr:Ig-like domain-containing protein [Candidatus Methanorudis spinitermitis]
MKKMESVFYNFKNNHSLLLIILLLFITIVISMSSVSAAYDTYTDIRVDTVDNVVPYLQFNITGTLYNTNNSAPISGQIITVTITGDSRTYINSATTDGAGNFRIPFVVNTSALHNARISYAGSGSIYSPTTVNMPIEAKKLASFFENVDVFIDGGRQISGQLVDEYGKPIVNGQVNLTVIASNGVTTLSSVVVNTNSTGHFTTRNTAFSIPQNSYDNNNGPNVIIEYLGNQTFYSTKMTAGMTSVFMYAITINHYGDVTVNEKFNLTGVLWEFRLQSGAVKTPMSAGHSINVTIVSGNGAVTNRTIITGTNGAFWVELDETYGNCSITFAYRNTSVLTVTETITLFVAKLPTYIEFDHPLDVTTGKASTISGKLYDKYGNGIGGKVVAVFVDGINIGGATTISDGSFSINHTFTTMGNHTITVVFDEDSNYYYFNKTIMVGVELLGSIVTVENVTVNVTEQFTINGNLTAKDDVKTPLSGVVTIEFWLDGVLKYRIENVPVNNGKFSYSNRFNVSGNYTVRVYYDGITDNIGGSYAEGWLLVLPKNTSVVVTNVTVRATDSFNLTGRIVDPITGFAINGTATITIIVGGVTLSNTVNVVDGNFRWDNIRINTTGNYTVSVTYNGNQIYAVSTGNGWVNVIPMPTTTTVNSAASKPGVQFNITGTVIADNGDRINGTVRINIRNDTLGVNVNYTANVINGEFILPVTLTIVGNYTVTATYDGNATYAGSYGTNTILIAEIGTLLTVTDSTVYTTQTFTISGTLISVDGTPLDGVYVTITITNITAGVSNNYTVRVNNGVFSYSNISYIGDFNYTVEVEFLGAGFYAESNATGWLQVNRIPTTITVSNETAFVYNRSTPFVALLWDTINNRPIAGATVEFFIDGIWVANRTTDINGKAYYYLTADFGTYNITVYYNGNLTYRESDNLDSTHMFTTREMETYIVVENVTTKPFRTGRITITLYNEFHEIIPFENLTVLFDGQTFTGSTDSLGRFFIPYSTTEAGIYPIIANSALTNSRLRASPQATGRLTVEMLDTKIIMKNVIVNALQAASFSATLVDEDGILLSNRMVDIFIDGEHFGTFTTDSYGKIYISLGLRPTGVYAITATFSGDPNVRAATISDCTLTVRPIRTTIFVAAVQNKNESTNFVARLYDEFNKPVVDRPIVFYLNGQFIGIAITNSNGTAILPYTYTPSGRIVAEFLGDQIYLESLDNRLFGNNSLVVNNDTNRTPKVLGDNDTKDGKTGNDTKDGKKTISAIAMLNTGNPIAMVLICLLSVLLIGLRRRNRN